jgi:hypothetical protein
MPCRFPIYQVWCHLHFNPSRVQTVIGISFTFLNTNIFYVLMKLSSFAAELFVNGEIVQRSPERQRRVEPVPQRAQDRPRYSDRTRYVKRRENQSYQR